MTSPREALSAPRRAVASFFDGLRAPLAGAKLVYLERPGLARYWIVPILVTIVALALSLAAALHFHGDVTGALVTPPEGDGWGDAILRALATLLDVVVAVVLALAALVVTALVGSIVAAPFNAVLADVVDEATTGRTPPPFSIRRALGDVARAMTIEIVFFVVNVVLFVLSLVAPVLGPVLGVVGLVLGAIYFALAYLEAPQASRGRGLGDRLRLVVRHPAAVIGFGTGVAVFVFVPIVNLFFMPAAVAGGVLLHAKLSPDSPDQASA